MLRFSLLPATLAALCLLTACSESEEASRISENAEVERTSPPPKQDAVKAEEAGKAVPRYDAAAFFQTTTYKMTVAGGRSFSPDGLELLVSSDRTGVFNAYVVPLDGTAPRALTESVSDAVFAVSWFPSDRRVLYSRDQGGNELSHLYVREESGKSRDLTPGEKLKADFMGWRADGKTFFVTSNERDQRFFDLYEYSVEDYSRTMIYQNDEAFFISAISGDGRYVVLDKLRTFTDSDIYLLDREAENPEPKLITGHKGRVQHIVFGFTPDDKALIYGTNEFGEFIEAWSYDLATGQKAPYVKADWDISFLSFSSSSRYRMMGVNADASTEITISDLETGETVTFPALPRGQMSQVRFNSAENKVAFEFISDISPTNIYIVDLSDRGATKLTEALNPEINVSHLVESEVIRYESFDGLEIPAILYKPREASPQNRVPALVWVHGGPGGQSRVRYNATIQYLVNQGYAILAANNRGSSGYGKTFFRMDDRKHGEVDLQDIVYGHKYLQGLGWVNGDQIGIIGESYGGYMVVAALAFEPDVFDAGINGFGVTNWVRTLTSIPPWWEFLKAALYDEMGDPATDGARHRRISPLFHAENIRKPLLVIQGGNDPRAPSAESEEIVAAVRANGVPVEYIVFEDEGHGFLKRENRIAASEAYVRFLDKYLRQNGAQPSGAESGAAAPGQ